MSIELPPWSFKAKEGRGDRDGFHEREQLLLEAIRVPVVGLYARFLKRRLDGRTPLANHKLEQGPHLHLAAGDIHGSDDPRRFS